MEEAVRCGGFFFSLVSFPGGPEYRSRIQSEQLIYQDCVEVHDLPPIFHYWSDKYVRPKLERFGFSNPDGAFRLFLERACRSGHGNALRFASIGAGNCDLEVEIARHLRSAGYSHFQIECLELNPAMLRRGEEAAVSAGVRDALVFTACDLNEWHAQTTYHAVMASQSLHHIAELEHLFDQITRSLVPDGYFVISDIIGRNGHQRWPEALQLVHEFWRELPPSRRWNRKLRRYEEMFVDWDCSGEGFEGIRSQDILPLLLRHFHFDFFVGFANVIDPFVDRSFGLNFDPFNEWDRAFVDAVHARDDAAIEAGEVTPTHMIAAVTRASVQTRYLGNVSPERSVRIPTQIKNPIAPVSENQSPYEISAWPDDWRRETMSILQILKEVERRSSEWEQQAEGWQGHAERWQERAASLESDLGGRTAWARNLDREIMVLRSSSAEWEREARNRLDWARGLESELQEKSGWAQRLDAEVSLLRTERVEVQAELEKRTAWALDLQRQLEERTLWALAMNGQLKRFHTRWYRLIGRAVSSARRARGLARRLIKAKGPQQ